MLTSLASEGRSSIAHHHRGDRIEQPLDTHPRPPAYELFWRGLPTAELCSTHKHTHPDIHQKANTKPTTLGLKWWGGRLLTNLGFKPSASWFWVLYHLLHRCITLRSWYNYPGRSFTPTVNWGTLLKWAPHVLCQWFQEKHWKEHTPNCNFYCQHQQNRLIFMHVLWLCVPMKW